MNHWKSTALIVLLLVSLMAGNIALLVMNRNLRAESEANTEEAGEYWGSIDRYMDENSYLKVQLFECRQNIDCGSSVRMQCCRDCYERMVSLGRRIAEGELCDEQGE